MINFKNESCTYGLALEVPQPRSSVSLASSYTDDMVIDQWPGVNDFKLNNDWHNLR